MAFLKKKSKFPMIVLICILFFVIIAAMAAGVYILYQRQIAELKSRHDHEVQRYQFELYQLERQVLVPKKDIRYGTLLSKEMFEQKSMKLAIKQDALLDESDMGKTSMVQLPAGIPVTKSTVTENKPAGDLREQEFNMFLIQTNQEYGDFVDVRIVFPNAENYIVLSKKQLKGLIREENIVWLWLDETEIHNISSAIIDAYLHPGTKLMVSTYILPEMQEAAIPYYPANPDVLDLMRKDPNILKKASDALAREARASLESHLQALATEELSMVSSGVSAEVTKNQEMMKILEQEKLIEKQNRQEEQIEKDKKDTFN